jgi:RES domain-containing protein
MSGARSKLSGGRWNSPGTSIVYCSSSIALAVLETLTTIRTDSLPYNRYLVRVAVPDAVWAAREFVAPQPGWDSIPWGQASLNAGDTWVASSRSLILLVPSVIVPEEFNVLINPLHPDAGLIAATTVKKWIFDPRFF